MSSIILNIPNYLFENNNQLIKKSIIGLLIFSIIALLHGSIKENIINASAIFIILITSFSMYLFFKKKYNSKIKELTNENKILKEPTVLDNICNKHPLNNVCIKYFDSKKNFFKISNLLLEQYKFS